MKKLHTATTPAKPAKKSMFDLTPSDMKLARGGKGVINDAPMRFGFHGTLRMA